ncbi:hypothetical protein QN239_20365 [Mycolicibacterium sp. Y3]
MRYTDLFEHGIEAQKGLAEPPVGLLRLATNQRKVHTGFVFEVVDQAGTFPNYRAMKLSMVNGSHCAWHFYEEKDVAYCLRTALYHLNRLIELYVNVRARFEEHHSSDAISGSTTELRIYYELDAFLGAARRIYESIRKVLWKHYAAPRGDTGRWRSIKSALTSDSVPADYAASLQQSWREHGTKLTDYRDCVMHYDPFADGGGGCYLNRFDGRWGVRVPLPTNPEAKSHAKFDNIRGEGPDALSYCYGVATHLTDICEELMALPEVASHMQNPRPMSVTNSSAS